jgi:hypothetical protein
MHSQVRRDTAVNSPADGNLALGADFHLPFRGARAPPTSSPRPVPTAARPFSRESLGRLKSLAEFVIMKS